MLTASSAQQGTFEYIPLAQATYQTHMQAH